jgi:putative addiction module killer protein
MLTEVRKTEAYSNWFSELKDNHARAKVLARVRHLSLGNPGDCKPVGEGVSEMRIHYGPGYRVYFVKHGEVLYFLLGGGTKKSQKRDIEEAIALARELKG